MFVKYLGSKVDECPYWGEMWWTPDRFHGKMPAMTTVSAVPDSIAREVAGNLMRLHDEREVSYRDIDRALQRMLGDDSPSHETIRQYHEGKVKSGRMNLIWVAALCRFYRRPLDEVAPQLAERARAVGLEQPPDLHGLVTGGKITLSSQTGDSVLRCAKQNRIGVWGCAGMGVGGTSWTTVASSLDTPRFSESADSRQTLSVTTEPSSAGSPDGWATAA